jgi:hypothetical protein
MTQRIAFEKLDSMLLFLRGGYVLIFIFIQLSCLVRLGSYLGLVHLLVEVVSAKPERVPILGDSHKKESHSSMAMAVTFVDCCRVRNIEIAQNFVNPFATFAVAP